MGPENQEKPTLRMWNEATGEWVAIPDTLVELTVSECEDGQECPAIRNLSRCYFCDHSDSARWHDGCIRCKRWSQWVAPDAQVCPEYTGFSMTIPLKAKVSSEIEKP